MTHGHESDHEKATIERLQLLGYEYLPGPDIDRDDKEVVLTNILKSSLAYRYPELNDQAIDLAVEKLTRPDGVDTLHRPAWVLLSFSTWGEGAPGRKT